MVTYKKSIMSKFECPKSMELNGSMNLKVTANIIYH